MPSPLETSGYPSPSPADDRSPKDHGPPLRKKRNEIGDEGHNVCADPSRQISVRVAIAHHSGRVGVGSADALGTVEVPPSDIDKIRRVAAGVLGVPEDQADLTVERAASGVSTIVFEVTLGADVFFLRLAEEQDESLEVDARVHRELGRLGVQVPEVVYVERRSDELDWSVMVTRHLGGRPLSGEDDIDTQLATMRAVGRDLAIINTQPVDGFSWIARDQPTWPLSGELSTFAAFVREDLPDPWPGVFSDLFETPDLDTIAGIVESQALRPIQRGLLVHGDIAYEHVFVRDGVYSGLIDFGEIRGAESTFDLGVFWTQAPREHRPEILAAVLDGYREVFAAARRPRPRDASFGPDDEAEPARPVGEAHVSSSARPRTDGHLDHSPDPPRDRRRRLTVRPRSVIVPVRAADST